MFLALAVIFTMLFTANAMGAPNDFFSKDSGATYNEEFHGVEVVTKIPNYKLTFQTVKIAKEDYIYAKRVTAEIIEKVKKYVDYRKVNQGANYNLYAAKELGEYLLLYFTEPGVMDGGFGLIYSNKLKKIIGCFAIGEMG